MRKTLQSLALVWALLLFALLCSAWQNGPSGTFRTARTLHSHTSAATITIPAPPIATQFIFVTGIEIANCAGGTAVTPAAPTFITVTNLGDAANLPQYMEGSGAAAGVCQPQVLPVPAGVPLRSITPGAAATVVLPTFATNQTISVNVDYYYAPAPSYQ